MKTIFIVSTLSRVDLMTVKLIARLMFDLNLISLLFGAEYGKSNCNSRIY